MGKSFFVPFNTYSDCLDLSFKLNLSLFRFLFLSQTEKKKNILSFNKENKSRYISLVHTAFLVYWKKLVSHEI